MSIHVTKEQTRLFGEKFIDLGNLALGGIVFTQLLPEATFNWRVALLGFTTFALLYVLAYYLTRGGE